jgi:predicted permease
MGASRSRLVRQLLTESVMLSLLGGTAGIVLAWYASAALASASGAWLPLTQNVRPDWLVLLFAFVLCMATGVAFGLIPASTSFTSVSGTLRESGRSNSPSARAHAMRRAFVAVELALAVMLVAGAALFVQSFSRLTRVDPGFDTEHVAFARMVLSKPSDGSAFDRIALGDRIIESVRSAPGVTAAAMITKHPPLRGAGEQLRVKTVGATYAPGTAPLAEAVSVTPGFFAAMNMNLVEGREIEQRDNDSGAVVVSRSVARTLWGDRSPVGQQIIIEDESYPVVGVAPDMRYARIDAPSTPLIYLSRSIMSRSAVTIVARGSGDPAQLIASLRTGIHAVTPDLPITEVATMRSVIDEATAAQRFLSWLLSLFAVLAVILAAIGVYGVVSYVVGQRRNEIGIRMALGAHTSGIVVWTLRTGMSPVVVGLLAGIFGASVLARLVRSQLFEMGSGSISVYLGVALLLGCISLAATAVPALRASRVDPTIALRAD